MAREENAPNFVCATKDAHGCDYDLGRYDIKELTTPIIKEEVDPTKGQHFANKVDIYFKDDEKSSEAEILEFTKSGAEAIHKFTRAAEKDVLVHCVAGMNRSVAIIIRYAIDYKKWSFKKAFNYIRSLNCEERKIPKKYTGGNRNFMRTLQLYSDRKRTLQLYSNRKYK